MEWAISDAGITTTRRRAWSISAKRGELDVWSTSDGSIFVEGVTSLNVVYALFPQFHEVCPALALEDRITRLPSSEVAHAWLAADSSTSMTRAAPRASAACA